MTRSRLVLVLHPARALAPAVAVVAVGTTPYMMPADRALRHGARRVAAITSVASLALSIAGARARDGRTVLMGMAFSTMTALFAVHALATPGFIVGMNGVIALAGGLSVPVGALLLSLTALPVAAPSRLRAGPRDRAGRALRRRAAVRPDRPLAPDVRARPCRRPSRPRRSACSSPAPLFLAPLIIRAVRTYLLTRRVADLTVALGCAWLGVTLFANLWIGSRRVGYLHRPRCSRSAPCCSVSVPAALDIKRAGASRPLVGDLTATELVASEQAYLGPRVRALMVRLERRDVSTEEHTRRVALLAARVGEELKLSATARRHLAVGGLLHDIGKLSVPLEILNKPGKLTDEEFDAIKRHPRRRPQAARRARRLPGGRPRPGLRPPRAPRRLRLPARPAAPTS